MATRTILTDEDPILHKVCKPVEKFDGRLWQLLDDMKDTLDKAQGVGLAAPQVGVLRRVFIMDAGDGLKECINPTILERRGTQECTEGCLSSPGEYGIIHRPAVVKLQAQNRHGKFFIVTLEGLAAQCADHETDHLDGVLFKSKVDRMLAPDEYK
jgi:peptide deformylase